MYFQTGFYFQKIIIDKLSQIIKGSKGLILSKFQLRDINLNALHLNRNIMFDSFMASLLLDLKNSSLDILYQKGKC